MIEQSNSYAFEMFPRDDLALKFNRRQLFSTFAIEFQVQQEQNQGSMAYRLSELGSLPDEQLALLIPVVVPGCKISDQEGFVWSQPPSIRHPIKLFPIESPALSAFNRFNGLTPLGAVGRHLAREMGWEVARGFAYARGLFLHLITLGVCLPK